MLCAEYIPIRPDPHMPRTVSEEKLSGSGGPVNQNHAPRRTCRLIALHIKKSACALPSSCPPAHISAA